MKSENETAAPTPGPSTLRANPSSASSSALRLHSKNLNTPSLLLVSDDPAGRGGVERGIIEVARAMSMRGWRAIILVPGVGATSRMCTEAGLEVVFSQLFRRPRFWRVRRYFPLDVWLRNAGAALRLRRLLQHGRVAVIYSAAKDSESILRWARFARRAQVPIIWSCHDTNPKVLTFCSRGLAEQVDQVIAVSSHVKNALLQAGFANSDKITVVNNGIDLDSWDAELAKQPTTLREELGIPPEPPVVGLVGRLDPVKGHLTFLRAAASVAQIRPDALFVLVGVVRPQSRFDRFAGYYREILAQIRSPALRGRVLYTGWRYRMAPVMASLDVLVQPSTRETFGRTLIEAMATRKPVVASSVGGMPEVVVDQETGLLVPQDDAPSLAAAIMTLLGDPLGARRMGDVGRHRVEKHFRLERRSARIASMCVGLADEGGHPWQKGAS